MSDEQQPQQEDKPAVETKWYVVRCQIGREKLMFTRLSFAQAIGQLLAVAIDCVVGLFAPRRRPTDVRVLPPK